MRTLVVVMAASVAMLPFYAAASPVVMSDAVLDRVVAGTGTPIPVLKGNNGWGNGADGTNPGSAAGGTSASKLAGFNQGGLGKINTNPTTSTGR
jgi:hypothetical protein